MAAESERIDAPPTLPPRDPQAHKGSFGRVLVVGGSRGMIGAPALAAEAALRGGAGLVTIATAETIQLAVAGLCPCATSIPLACANDGFLAAGALRQLAKAMDESDVIAIGPGLGTGQIQANLVQAVLEQTKPVVIDADALNNLSLIDDWPALRQCPAILTPHPGEFARLTGSSTGDVQSSREQLAVQAAGRWREASGAGEIVCVLKGAATVVTDGERIAVNTTGNAGMATGGSGDVLTGLIAALAAQGMELFDAACLGAFAHGLAGDMAADEVGQISLIATDVLEFLAPAMREIHEAGADD